MKTQTIIDAIERCESMDDYKKMFIHEIHEDQLFYSDWEKHISTLLREHALTRADIARGLNVSRATATKFIESIPSKRKNVVMIAMMLHMNLEETNELLVRWARFQKLYVKNPEDAIWIYLINNKKYDSPAAAFELLYGKYLDLAYKETPSDSYGHTNTRALDSELMKIVKDDEFINWMSGHISEHKTCCDKLVHCLDAFLNESGEFINQWFGSNETMKRDKYYRIIRELKEKGRIPARDFLISLGLHLKLGTRKINELLEAAGMGGVLAKDQLEGLIMFFIEELYCSYPSMFSEDADPTSFFLLDAEPDGMDEDGEPIEFPADTLASYVKFHIEESGIDFKDQRRVKDFLGLI